MRTSIETTEYFTSVPASRLTRTDWQYLYERLATGERIPVHASVWASVLEQGLLRSASRAGLVLELRGMLVRLSDPATVTCWVQALPVSAEVARRAGHLHSIVPITLSDGWCVLRCVECAREW